MSELDAARAWVLVRPYIRAGATDVLRLAARIELELAEGHGAIVDGLEARLAERVALGEGYGWNLYALESAWSAERLELEVADEVLDAIVYRALTRRLQVLAIEGLSDADAKAALPDPRARV